jgi:TP901 family phage tail tape measure protein
MAKKKAELRARISADARDFMRTMGRVKNAVAQTAKLLAGAAVAGGIFSVREAARFEKGMAEVNTIAGLTDDQLLKLKKDARALAVQFGLTTDELTGGLYQALSAGVSEADVLPFLETAAKAAKAGVTDLKTSVDAMTTVTNAWGAAAGDAETIGDTFFTVIREGKTTFEELNESLGNVANVAAASGVSFNETGAALAALTKTGLDSSKASVALRGVMTALLKPSEDLTRILGGKIGADAIKQFGGLQGVLEHVSERVNGNKAVIAKLFPNVRGLGAVFGLTGDKAAEFARISGEVNTGAGAMSEAFKTMQDTSAFALDQALAQARDLAITFGEALLPALTDILKEFTAWLAEGDNMDTMKEAALSTAEAIVMLAKGLKASVDFANMLLPILQKLVRASLALSTLGLSELAGAVGSRRSAATGAARAVGAGGPVDLRALQLAKRRGFDTQRTDQAFFAVLEQIKLELQGKGITDGLPGSAKAGA